MAQTVPRHWMRDVKVLSDHDILAETTGGEVWEATHHLLRYLETVSACRHPTSAATSQPQARLHQLLRGDEPCRILELGAGCGLLGLTVARNRSHASVTLTEQLAGLEHLKKNCDANTHLCAKGSQCSVMTCDWTLYGNELKAQKSSESEACPSTPETKEDQQRIESDKEKLQASDFDLLLGADLVYNSIGASCLPKVFAAHITGTRTQAIYAHTLHRYDLFDHEFFQALVDNGLDYRELDTSSCAGDSNATSTCACVSDAEHSDDQTLSSFTWSRIAVFHIFRPPDGQHIVHSRQLRFGSDSGDEAGE